MLIDETFLRTVVFLCVEETTDDGSAQKVPRATGFLVQIPEDTLTWYYVVTSSHCIEEARAAADGGRLFVRINSANGPFQHIETRVDDWFIHHSADVATTILDPSSIYLPLEPTAALLEQFVAADSRYRGPPLDPASALDVEIGSELCFVGLFVQHAGSERNLPIARFGHVSRMLGEPVSLRRNNDTIEALVGYLAECHSWGGHSGSPVFIGFPWQTQQQIASPLIGVPPRQIMRSGHVMAVLGLVSAHFPIAEHVKTQDDPYGIATVEINAGIALITPADAIRHLLTRDDVVAQRAQPGVQRMAFQHPRIRTAGQPSDD